MSLIFRIWNILNCLAKLSSVGLRLDQLPRGSLLVEVLVLELGGKFIIGEILLDWVRFLNEFEILVILVILIILYWRSLKLRTYLWRSVLHVLLVILNIHVFSVVAESWYELIRSLLHHYTAIRGRFSSRALGESSWIHSVDAVSLGD